MPWTEPQREAISHDGSDVLVAAGAGAGKTGVLTERVVRRVADDGWSVTDLLVVTFTEAAAAQMRRRIADRLGQVLAEAGSAGDQERVRRLTRQVVLLDAGHICTLHSFCSHLLREHFHHLGLDPAFEVLDEDESALVRQEVLDGLLEGYYNDAGERRRRFEQLLAWLTPGRDDSALRRTILRLDEKVNSLVRPGQWWQRVAEALSLGPDGSLAGTAWGESLRRLFELEFEAISSRLDQARAMASADGAGAVGAYLGPIDTLIGYLGRLRECLDRDEFWDELAGPLGEYPIARLPTVRGEPPGKAAVKKLLDQVKGTLRDLQGLTGRRQRDLLADLSALAPQAGMLAGLCDEYHRAFDAAKRERGQLDFADLERFAFRLLDEFPAVRAELAGRFREVLVDEYQDISPIQDAILHAVTGRAVLSESGLSSCPETALAEGGGAGPLLFMVGDLKQSIYRFRLAEPNIFLRKYEGYRPGVPASADPPAGVRIDLPDNFRSRRAVINGVNAVFERLMQPVRTLLSGQAGPVYDQTTRLRFAAPCYQRPDALPDAPVEVHLLEKTEPGPPGPPDGLDDGGEEDQPVAGEAGQEELTDLAQLERARVQARFIGRRIRQLLGADGSPPAVVWDDRAEQWRPARCRDIVILLRTAKRVAQRFAEELTAMGLAVHAAEPGGYFEAVEVSDVRSLLAVLDNPRQDIPLAAVLRSPLMLFAGGALSADELAAVRLAHGDGEFYDAVASTATGECGAGNADAGRPQASGMPDSDEPRPLSDRLRRFLNQVDRWRTMARRRPLSELLADIFRVTGYLDYVSGLRGGPQRRANLLHLAHRARQFDTFARQGLARFARFLDELDRAGEELGVPGPLSEAEDVVRIITVHRAKGLEFPIVVLADLEHLFNFQDSAGDVLFHRELLLGLRCVDRGRRVRFDSIAHHLIARQLRMETVLEEMRLLYVAMTRARDRLILVGSEDRLLDGLQTRWAGEQTAGSVLRARRPLDWVAPAVLAGPAGRQTLDGIDELEFLPSAPLAADDGVFSVHVHGAGSLAELVSAPGQEVERPALKGWLASASAGLPLDSSKPAGQSPGASAPGSLDDPGAPGAVHQALADRLAYRYPLAELTGQPAKRSVSELKGLFETRVEPDEQGPADAIPGPWAIEARSPVPPWELPPRSDARARGVATHAVLQRLDLSADLDDSGQVADQVLRMQANGLLQPGQADLVDCDAIAGFFATELGRRIRARRDRVRREWPFSLAVPVGELMESPPVPSTEGSSSASAPACRFALTSDAPNDRVLVQGIIDVVLETDSPDRPGLLILDFKTDSVRTDREIAERASAYRGQMAWYARAAGAILGKPVVKNLLHFLTPGRLVELAIG